MKKDIVCPSCEEVIANVHGYQRPLAIVLHLKTNHPDIYQSLTKRARELKILHQEFSELSGMINYQMFLHE